MNSLVTGDDDEDTRLGLTRQCGRSEYVYVGGGGVSPAAAN